MDIDETARTLLETVNKAAQLDLVSQLIGAYDNFAATAMAALISEASPHVSEEVLIESCARRSWLYADAMMAERKKRGLGGAP